MRIIRGYTYTNFLLL